MLEQARHQHLSVRLLLASLLVSILCPAVALADPSLGHDGSDDGTTQLMEWDFASESPDMIAQQVPPNSEVLQLSISRETSQVSAPSDARAHSLQLSTSSTLLRNEDDILLELVNDRRQSDPAQPTLIASIQGLMPLYLHSVRNAEEERLGIRSVRSGTGENSDSLNQFLERFSNRHHCNLAWQSPTHQPAAGVELEHHLAIQRTSFSGSSLCQPLRPTEEVSLLSRLTFLPLEFGEFASLDWGSVNYTLLRDEDGQVTGSIGISPSFAIDPIDGLHLELNHELKFEGDPDIRDHWFVAAHIHETGAIVSVQLPEVAGNDITLSAESAYDWVDEEWEPGKLEVAWDIAQLGVQWEAKTEYRPSEMELQPISLSFQHELPWDIRWGFRTRYRQEDGELDPLDFTFDHDLPLMEWLTANDDTANHPALGLRYGVQTQQSDRNHADYAVGVGLEIGDQDTGQWDLRVNWEGTTIDSLSTSFDRQDWRMLVRVEPDPDDYSIEGRLTLFSGQ